MRGPSSSTFSLLVIHPTSPHPTSPHPRRSIHWAHTDNKYAPHKAFNLSEVVRVVRPPNQIAKGVLVKANPIENNMRLYLQNGTYQVTTTTTTTITTTIYGQTKQYQLYVGQAVALFSC